MVPTLSANADVSGERRTTAVVAPNAFTRLAISRPIGPKPIISQLVCEISRKGVIFQCFSRCCARCKSIGCTRLSTCAMVNSEMAIAWALLLQMRVPLRASAL